MNNAMQMYQNDDEAYAAAMDYFEGAAFTKGRTEVAAALPALYPTAAAAHEAAMDFFGGVL